MSDFDPWAPDEQEYVIDKQPDNPYEPPSVVLKEKKTVANSDGAVTLTFKAGKDFNDPWLVLRAESVDEANGILRESVEKGLDKALVQFARALHNEYKPQGGYQPQSQAAPQQQPFQAPAQAPQSAPQGGDVQHKQPQSVYGPGGVTKTCSHGFPMEYREGTSTKGNDYKVFSCTSTDRDQQDKGIFVK